MNYTPEQIAAAIDPERNPNHWRETVTLGICTLFWKQTPDEIASKMTIYKNDKGFNSHDAARGVKMARYAMRDATMQTLPDTVIGDAYNMVYKYRRQLANIMNVKAEREEALKYIDEKSLTESKMKNDTDKKIKDMKSVQNIMRKDRIQNMKKPSIHTPDTTYKRNKKVDTDD